MMITFILAFLTISLPFITIWLISRFSITQQITNFLLINVPAWIYLVIFIITFILFVSVIYMGFTFLFPIGITLLVLLLLSSAISGQSIF